MSCSSEIPEELLLSRLTSGLGVEALGLTLLGKEGIRDTVEGVVGSPVEGLLVVFEGSMSFPKNQSKFGGFIILDKK